MQQELHLLQIENRRKSHMLKEKLWTSHFFLYINTSFTVAHESNNRRCIHFFPQIPFTSMAFIIYRSKTFDHYSSFSKVLESNEKLTITANDWKWRHLLKCKCLLEKEKNQRAIIVRLTGSPPEGWITTFWPGAQVSLAVHELSSLCNSFFFPFQILIFQLNIVVIFFPFSCVFKPIFEVNLRGHSLYRERNALNRTQSA